TSKQQRELEQAARRAERERKRLQKEAERLAKEAERQKREEERRLKKEEELRKKEEERQAKEEEKKAKEEERAKLKEAKEEERKAKEEEKAKLKEAKEEERKAKEEERKAKEDEKQKRQEEERRQKEKQASLLASFFIKKPAASSGSQSEVGGSSQTEESAAPEEKRRFMPFPLRRDARLCPAIRREPLTESERNTLEQFLSSDAAPQAESYLTELKHRRGRSCPQTWPLSEFLQGGSDPDVVMVTETQSLRKCKLLQFCENHRPAYFGTWGRRSSAISGRNPLSRDAATLDYDVDSEAEWEEEGEGEDLDRSEGDPEEAGSDDDDEDEAAFVVPHGYLSDDEGENPAEAEEEAEDAETRKKRQQLRQRAFEESQQRKVQRLKPILFGISFAELAEIAEEAAFCCHEALPVDCDPPPSQPPTPDEAGRKRPGSAKRARGSSASAASPAESGKKMRRPITDFFQSPSSGKKLPVQN
ncbi:hypothetical protein BOX15_Mlig023199g3, partial [Macrostomum lignano]